MSAPTCRGGGVCPRTKSPRHVHRLMLQPLRVLEQQTPQARREDSSQAFVRSENLKKTSPTMNPRDRHEGLQ